MWAEAGAARLGLGRPPQPPQPPPHQWIFFTVILAVIFIHYYEFRINSHEH